MDSMRIELESLEYPGRLIIIGAAPEGGRAAILYAITGRSPSSQARRLVLRNDGIWVEPTDEATLRCVDGTVQFRNAAEAFIGFRCCWDP